MNGPGKERMTRIGAVLFDFDMTLVDSSYAITECTNLLADAKGLARVTREEILKVIGLPIEESWRTLWGCCDPEWLDYYRKNFREVEQRNLRDFPGTRTVPKMLRSMGLKLAVVSNRKFARIAVEKSGLLPFFDVIIGLEDVKNPKPHPEPVLTALERLGVEPGRAVYVGDTDIDVKTAKHAGVVGIGMPTGGFDERNLKASGADFVCSDLREIPKLLGGRAYTNKGEIEL